MILEGNMFYNEKYVYYRCELRSNNLNSNKIKNALISILGEPRSTGLLHPFSILNENWEEDGEGYQITLTPRNLKILHNKCLEMNISFEDVFERDWRHFHIQYYYLSEEHEGTAYEHENFWELFYEDGSLADLPALRDNNFFIQKIYKEDINGDLDKIDRLFEKWIQEQIKQ
jgi:hypothetical protein